MWLKKLYKEIQYWRSFDKRLHLMPPVFLLQMGKVASTSINTALRQYYKGAIVYGYRFSNQYKFIEWSVLWYLLTKQPRIFKKARRRVRYYLSYWEIRRLRKFMMDYPNRKIKLISLIRNPIERDISAFFQEIEKKHNDLSLPYLNKVFNADPKLHFSLNWFDENIKPYFGIDVYDYPFGEDGFIFITKNNIELLLMQYDLDNAKKEQLIKDFLGINTFHIQRLNVGAKKQTASIYKQFKNEAIIADEILATYAQSKYFNHFYSPEEIEASVEKYSRK